MDRTRYTRVEFRQPFQLPDWDAAQPPGSYEIETVEELIPGLSFTAYRRVSTAIILTGSSKAAASRQVTAIEPEDLAAALKRDGEAHDVSL